MKRLSALIIADLMQSSLQVWAIAEGRGAAAATDKFLAGVEPSTDARQEVVGGIIPWKEFSQKVMGQQLVAV